MIRGQFSVIIPTLQRAAELWPLVDQCASHPLVAEVLVINNSPEPLTWESPKVRVLQQAENIFVNPAWNLGAREAKAEWLAIVNDDVRFKDEALHEAARVLKRGWFAMVSADRSCFAQSSWDKPISHRLAVSNNKFMGVFMALRRSDYIPIPGDMLIWGGDDMLWWAQRRPNAVLIRTPFVTDMSTTTRSPEFQALWDAERIPFHRMMQELDGARWWHRPVRAYHRLKNLRYTCIPRLKGLRGTSTKKEP